MIFSFDKLGFLPPEIIRCSITELYENFVEPFPLSETRKMLYENWLEYIGSLQELTGSGFTQWLNGSFVTTKLNPQDLDMVTFIDYQIYRKFETDLEPYWTHHLEDQALDAYLVTIYPDYHPKFDEFKGFKDRWFSRFSTAKGTNGMKGFVEIKFR